MLNKSVTKSPFLPSLLTPQSIALLQAVHHHGSMAAAARALGQVPSALSYRMRRLEEALDVLLLDRSSRHARLTDAGRELMQEGSRLLLEFEALALRVKRVATGWEPQLTLAVDTVICQPTLVDLCQEFFQLGAPTRLRIRQEALSGTLAVLLEGRADLAIGVTEAGGAMDQSVQTLLLGHMGFVYAVAPQHPLAAAQEPISDAQLMLHRAVAVADSVARGNGWTFGLLGGQEIFTVSGMPEKLAAQVRGIGGGFLPEHLARPQIEAGHLVEKSMQRTSRLQPLLAAWRRTPNSSQHAPGQALQWWLAQLDKPHTRKALLGQR